MQNTWRSRTQKRQQDISGNAPIAWKGPTSDALETFLNAGASEAFKRPWHRLERGLRLNRIHLFAEEEKTRLGLNGIEAGDLYTLLVKSLDDKLLNSKSNVIYDHETMRILEIKGLVMHRSAEGRLLFQIPKPKANGKTNSITFRKPRTAPSSDPKPATTPTTE
jgi:hypothetical protein